MMEQRMIITGANGQLGKELVKQYPNATAMTKEALDITNAEEVAAVDWSSYDVIVNAAAYVNADRSETKEGRELTWKVNAEGPKNLAKVALENGLNIIHFSSEYVFDGTIPSHLEDEPFTPLSVYGQTKAAADLAVSLVPNHHILRTTWVVGEGHNFVKTMKNLADMRIDPKVVDDQYGRLTFTSELVRAVGHILDKNVDSGTYNLSNSGKVRSWADIARLTFSLAGHDAERIKSVSTEEYMQEKTPFAPRPTHSDLDLSKIQRTGFKSQDYEPLMDAYIKSLKPVE